MNTTQQIPRSRQLGTGGRLALAAVVAAVGLTASIAWAAVGLSDQTLRPAEMVTTTIPGSVSLEVNRPGAHVVYLESTVPTEVRGLDPVLGLAVSDLGVTNPQGTPVEVETYTRDLRYDVARDGAGVIGEAVAVFDAGEPGEYRISTSAQLGDRQARIAVGDDLAPGVLRAVLLPLLTAVLSLAIAVVLAVRALIRAGRQDRTAAPTGGAR